MRANGTRGSNRGDWPLPYLGLAVIAREVVDAADRWPATESGMSSVMVVPVDPGLQGAIAGGVGAIQPPIRPLLQHGAVEPLHLAVRLWPVGAGPPMPHATISQRGPEQPAAVADPVVGQDPGHGDAVQGEPMASAVPEPSAGLGSLVAQDLDIGQPRVVVDRGVQVVVAAA